MNLRNESQMNPLQDATMTVTENFEYKAAKNLK